MNDSIENKLFDEKFRHISYNSDIDNRLQAIEVQLEYGDKKYALGIETYTMHMQRIDTDEDESQYDGDPTLVIPADEILPSDLTKIKRMTFEELKPFLVEQVTDLNKNF